MHQGGYLYAIFKPRTMGSRTFQALPAKMSVGEGGGEEVAITSAQLPHPPFMSRSGGEKGLRGSGAGTLGVPLGGTRRVGCMASENDWTALSFCLQFCTVWGKTTSPTLLVAARPAVPGP